MVFILIEKYLALVNTYFKKSIICHYISMKKAQHKGWIFFQVSFLNKNSKQHRWIHSWHANLQYKSIYIAVEAITL